MSKIYISVKNKQAGLKLASPAVQFIHRVAKNVGLKEAQRRIADGKYFYAAELYMNDHVSVDQKIRDILDGLDRLGLGCCLVEVLSDAKLDDLEGAEQALIDQQVLLNMLDEAVGRYS